MSKTILVINAGSSSIKFSIFNTGAGTDLELIYHGMIEIIDGKSNLYVFNTNHEQIFKQSIDSADYSVMFINIIDWINHLPEYYTLAAIGHRVVHGGKTFTQPVTITSTVIEEISQLIALAPLHQGYNLEAIKIIANLYPQLPQVACFDTTFHRTQEHLATLFAIPRQLTSSGIIRYGFHGISYEYISSVLIDKIGEAGNKRVIVAHLGNGASMCAMNNLQSVSTSMGFTTLDGLMMGTRCGNIDPGVLLYLMQEKHYTVEKLLHLVYQESGLLGVSGISNDIRELLASNSQYASEAIELFCYRAAGEIGLLGMALGGLNALVFTAGIGERAAQIRQKICTYLHWLGVELDASANNKNATIISTSDSQIIVSVIPTNEELMIAKHTQALVDLVPPDEINMNLKKDAI